MSLCKRREKRLDVDKTIDAARLEARATAEKILFTMSDALH
jgi:hypothetical protein